jgi:Fe2+ transport system protein FeoA
MAAEHGKTLADLGVGEPAVVREVGGDRAVACRLMEMGLLPGTRVEVARVAPLGDPIEVRLRSYALSIRRSEARAVRVTT